MLTLVTGNPGNGKTLHTLQLVEKERLAAIEEKTESGALRYPNGRAVYQRGIHGLTLPWLELPDAHDWFKCPEGSIIVIDEAWKAFPMRKAGGEVPRYIEEFAVHRHHGFDIYLVTQHRHQVDTFVRKMVGRHIHLVRKWGAEHSKVYQWEEETDTSSRSAKEKAISFDWTYPKEIYGWYKSAEVHTVKKDFPWRRFWWLIPLGLVVGCLVPYAVWRVTHLREINDKVLADAGSPAAGPGASASSGSSGPGSAVGSIWRPRAVAAREPFIPGSAPRYDGVYKLATAPVVSGCMELRFGLRVECRCTNQGGQVLALTTAECVAMVRVGWFDPSLHYVDAKESNVQFLQGEAGHMVQPIEEQSKASPYNADYRKQDRPGRGYWYGGRDEEPVGDRPAGAASGVSPRPELQPPGAQPKAGQEAAK